MPKRRNLVAFWAIFWYKGTCTTGSILIEAVISEAVRIGCSRVRQLRLPVETENILVLTGLK
jgi:hypothetical protein